MVSGVSWLGDEGVSGVRRVGEGVGLGIAGSVRETVRVEGRWMRSVCIRWGTAGNG